MTVCARLLCLTVCLAAGASGILLHEAIGHGMEADFNRKGTSIYTDMIGKKVAEPFVNIIDQGTLAGVRNAEKSTALNVVFNVPLPARGADQKAVKQVHTLHVVIKNEW